MSDWLFLTKIGKGKEKNKKVYFHHTKTNNTDDVKAIVTVTWTPQQADRLKVSMQKKSQEKMQNAQMNALALTREYFLLGCACLSKGAGCL